MHDEVAAIAETVAGALRFSTAVVVVDDGSRDGSGEAALRAGAELLRHDKRRGKGAALRSGLSKAAAREPPFAAFILLDGDGQHLPAEMPRLLAAFAEGAELVIGDRSADFGAMPLLRRLTNRLMTRLLRPLAGSDLRDSQCGFRLLGAALWRRLELRAEHFDIESEMLIAAFRAGARRAQVPVSVAPRRGASKIRPLADGWRFLALLCRSGLEALAGRGRRQARAQAKREALELDGCLR
jgi:glycosyltransferase involved in cell wall biosynthesis